MAAKALSLLAIAGVAVVGCRTYFEEYREAHPDWHLAFPSPGADLRESAASLYAPASGTHQTSVTRIWIARVDREPFAEISIDDLRSGAYAVDDSHDYAIAALTYCHAQYAFENRETHLSWYVLPANRLAWFDHHEYTHECLVVNEYRPAPSSRAGVERRVVETAERELGAPVPHRIHLYRKGLALVAAGRRAEARTLLRRGDAQIDPSVTHLPRSDRGPSRAAIREDEARARADLLAALEAAE